MTFPRWNDLTVKERMSKERKWNLIADAINGVSSEEVNGVPPEEELYDIHIDVTDGENPVTGATVVIGETTRTTGEAGGCNFTGLTAKEYTVTVTKEGYVEKTETIVVSANNLSFTIILLPAVEQDNQQVS